MKYSDILKVLAVYEERSFTAASKRLLISQPSISESIARLERELNVPLFVRENRIVRPTEACEKFVVTGLKITSLWQELEKEMRKYVETRTLRIGTTSFFFRFLSNRMESLRSNVQQGFRYKIIEDSAANVERMTKEGKLDFCYTRALLQEPSLMSEHLFTEEILLVLPQRHPACRKYPPTPGNPYPVIDLTEFRNATFVMVNNPRITPICVRMCENAGFIPNVTVQPATWEHVLISIRANQGVGFLSNLHIKKEYGDGLRFFHLKSGLARLEHVVAYRSAKELSQEARGFINSFRAYIQSCLPK